MTHHINHDGRVAMAAHLATETGRGEQALAAALAAAMSRSTDLLGEVVKERDALKADAERYRWLRDKSRSVDWSMYVNVESTPPCTAYSTTCRATGDQMNEAIDRAMKGTS